MIERKYSLSEIKLIPDVSSKIQSRSFVNTTYINGQSALIASPMDTVISLENKDTFLQHSNVCLPRNSFEEVDPQSVTDNNLLFYSMGLNEFSTFIKTHNTPSSGYMYCVLLDIANGHMQQAIDLTKESKNKFGNQIILMAGNIANPKAILQYAHVDYIRIGIGGGSACLTSTKTGIHFPMASLIRECAQIKEQNNLSVKIIADGGIATFSDIIVSLALGADYVMLGKLFNKTIEAIGPKFIQGSTGKVEISNEKAIEEYYKGTDVYNLYRGMSTEDVQKKWKQWNNNAITELKVSEGTKYFNKVSYDLATFIKNYNHNLSSAMSYCNKLYLEEFINLPDDFFIIVSDFAHQQIKNKPNYDEEN
jgi:hypothetical protein